MTNDLWGTDLPPIVEPVAPVEQEKSVNPCIDMFGPGPAGAICRDCIHLHGFRQSKIWYKCSLRAWTSKGGKNAGTVYPGGDHRVRWPACAKFELRSDSEEVKR